MQRGPPSQEVDTVLNRSQDNCQHDRSPMSSLWNFIVSPVLGDIQFYSFSNAWGHSITFLTLEMPGSLLAIA